MQAPARAPVKVSPDSRRCHLPMADENYRAFILAGEGNLSRPCACCKVYCSAFARTLEVVLTKGAVMQCCPLIIVDCERVETSCQQDRACGYQCNWRRRTRVDREAHILFHTTLDDGSEFCAEPGKVIVDNLKSDGWVHQPSIHWVHTRDGQSHSGFLSTRSLVPCRC